MLRTGKRFLTLLAMAMLLSSGASGYYFYIHFTSTFLYNPVPEKFDVSSLRNKTLPFFISDSGPNQYATGDNYAAVISQIRAAAKAWNDVDSSDLRLAFGGLSSGNVPQNAPGIDVVFDDDLPPGVLALGGPTSCVTGSAGCAVVSIAGNSAVAITRSTLHLGRDLSKMPSSGEAFFTTVVHEFGHTLGLQHTLTSGAMATSITRATTKAKPLLADDIAAISVLYPTGGFLSQTGSISGRVTLGGAGVNLASVVAIAVNGAAVSALTTPDGSYTIQGIPAGQSYLVYVHPLPDAISGESRPAGIIPPKDPSGNEIPRGSTYFDTVFYPGTKDPSQAQSLFLNGGDSRSGINFTVNRRTGLAISSVTTYAYVSSSYVQPALVLSSADKVKVVSAGPGVLTNGILTPGLGISVLGQSGATLTPDPITLFDVFAYYKVAPTFGGSSGSRHLLFSANNDIYVLPNSLLLTTSSTPAVTSVNAGFDQTGGRIATISGSNLDSITRVLFDGASANIVRRNGDGSLTVTPPAAAAGYRASVVALSSDGQSSIMLQPSSGFNPAPTYSYDSGDSPSVAIAPSSLAAGSEAMVDITTANFTFDGQATLGFGSSDVSTRRIWVLGPNHIVANVSVSSNAALNNLNVTVGSGLQLTTQSGAFQVQPQNSRQIVMTPPTNQATGAAGVPSGGMAQTTVTNLTASQSSITITVADQPAAVLMASNGTVVFQVPNGLPLGAAIVRMQIPGADPIQPVVMNIDSAPPAITGAYSAPGVLADALHPAVRGSLVTFSVTGLPDLPLLGDGSSIHVSIAGVDHTASSVSLQNGTTLVGVLMSPFVPGFGQVNANVSYNGASSPSFLLPIK